MSDDLTVRLLDLAHCNHDDVSVAAEAADEIERLRVALRRVHRTGEDGTRDEEAPAMWAACREIAAKALGDD